jgi:acyl carrier protein
MGQPRKLLLEPDWPRIRQLVAKELGKSKDQVQAMVERGDSLDRVDLVIAIEEVLDRIHR